LPLRILFENIFAEASEHYALTRIYQDEAVPTGVRASADRWDIESDELWVVDDPDIQLNDHASMTTLRPGQFVR